MFDSAPIAEVNNSWSFHWLSRFNRALVQWVYNAAGWHSLGKICTYSYGTIHDQNERKLLYWSHNSGKVFLSTVGHTDISVTVTSLTLNDRVRGRGGSEMCLSQTCTSLLSGWFTAYLHHCCSTIATVLNGGNIFRHALLGLSEGTIRDVRKAAEVEKSCDRLWLITTSQHKSLACVAYIKLIVYAKIWRNFPFNGPTNVSSFWMLQFRCSIASDCTQIKWIKRIPVAMTHTDGGDTSSCSPGPLLKRLKSVMSLSISSLSDINVSQPVPGDRAVMKSQILICSHLYSYLWWFSWCVMETGLGTVITNHRLQVWLLFCVWRQRTPDTLFICEYKPESGVIAFCQAVVFWLKREK